MIDLNELKKKAYEYAKKRAENGGRSRRQRPPGKRRFSGRSYKNSEQRLNELREKYKNGVTAEIMQEFAENLQIPRDFTKEN